MSGDFSMITKLHFPWPAIETLLEEVRTAGAARTLYGKITGKGLWLVGDQGVYFMANTTDGIHLKHRRKDDPPLVAYARECDPTSLPFDSWWTNKGSTFGGDDGVEFFPLELIEKFGRGKTKPDFLVAEFKAQEIIFTIL
jgi:hypothetical protein